MSAGLHDERRTDAAPAQERAEAHGAHQVPATIREREVHDPFDRRAHL